MSVSASLDLRIMKFDLKEPISPIKTLKLLIDHGWNPVNSEGEVFYLPLGDEDTFNWIFDKMSIVSLMKILEEKEQNGEIVGVTLTWKNTGIGGQVLLQREKEMIRDGIHTSMSFSLTINRKILSDYGNFKMTDVNWYLQKLLPVFNQNDMRVEFFNYEENI